MAFRAMVDAVRNSGAIGKGKNSAPQTKDRILQNEGNARTPTRPQQVILRNEGNAEATRSAQQSILQNEGNEAEETPPGAEVPPTPKAPSQPKTKEPRPQASGHSKIIEMPTPETPITPPNS